MTISKFLFSPLCIATLALVSPSLLAEPAPKTTTINPLQEFVKVDFPGNPSDANGLGKVDTNFLIAKFHTTVNQYAAFLNAVETTATHGFYHSEMGSDPSVQCITRSLSEDGIHFVYSIIEDRGKLPITYVSWIDAACFCNWLHHDCPIGDDVTDSVLFDGAYRFYKNGEEQMIELMPGARYFLPDRNQFHKAAFYRSNLHQYWDYPTQALAPIAPGNTIGASANQANYFYTSYFWGNSHSTKGPLYITPVGSFSASPGPFGTYDLGSNVKNWSSDFNEDGNALAEGGSWKTTCEMLRNNAPDTPLDPTNGYDDVGFRVAAPSPFTVADQVAEDKKALAQQNFNKSDAAFVGSIVMSIARPIYKIGEWSVFNIGTEVLEILVFEQLGLYALVPYCIYMGAVICNECEHGDYLAAAGTLVHGFLDLACMLGNQMNYKVSEYLVSALENCHLKFVADFVKYIHESVHDVLDPLVHCLGIPHSHNTPSTIEEIDEIEEKTISGVAASLKNFLEGPEGQRSPDPDMQFFTQECSATSKATRRKKKKPFFCSNENCKH